MTVAASHPVARLRAAATSRPMAPAINAGDETLLYGELWEALGRWTRVLTGVGLMPGKPVAVVSRSRSRQVRAIWLAVFAGCPVLPVNPAHPAARSLISDCGINQIIADADIDLPRGIRRLPARRLDEVPEGPAIPGMPLAVNAVQLLVATSGTEGAAQAGMLSCANLSASASNSCEALDLRPTDAWLACLPLTHIAGIAILFRCAAVGACMHLHERFVPEQIWADIQDGEITHLSLVPSMLYRMLETSNDAAPPFSLRQALIGGSPLSLPLGRRARAAGWPLRETYGMTETTSHVALAARSDWTLGLDTLPGSKISIVDDNRQPTSETGRIQITGPTVMLGYANNSLKPGDGLSGERTVTSQDLGRFDEDGRLRVLGRADAMLVTSGANIHPAEVESLLAGCPGLNEAAVTGLPDPVWGQRLIALYTGDARPDAVKRWTKEKILRPLRPREFYRIRELPRNALGKLKRADLPGLVPGI